MPKETVIRARIAEDIKEQATEALDQMGLSVSDVVRVVMTRIAAEKALPFDIRVPNKTTRKAFADVSAGRLIRHRHNRDAFKDLDL